MNEISLDKNDSQLIELSEKGLLALSLDEMKIIKQYYLREDVKGERKNLACLLGLPTWNWRRLRKRGASTASTRFLTR